MLSAFFILSNEPKVQIQKSNNDVDYSEEKRELLSAINNLPEDLDKMKGSLTVLVNDVEEILDASDNKAALTGLNDKDKEKLNQSIESMYKQAGLDFSKEEVRIKEAFEEASSDPETLFNK